MDVPLPNVPFKVEYDGLQITRDNSASYIDVGRSSNDRILIGQWIRTGLNGIICYTSSGQTNHQLPSNTSLNTWHHFTFTYDGTDYKIDRDGESLNITGVGIHLDKIIHIERGGGGKLKNIRVKPL